MARDDAVVPQDPAVVYTEAWGLVKTLGPQKAGSRVRRMLERHPKRPS